MRGEWAKARICALTSRAEGFPLVVQEAMAAGVPVASYDCPSGPREIIQHEVNGLLVAPESIAGMASALLRLATDDELRRALGEGALPDLAAVRRVRARRAVGRHLRRRPRAPHDRRPAEPRASRALVAPKPVPTAAAEAVAATGVTPAQARQGRSRWAVAAARAATDSWFVIPAHESGEPGRRGADGRPRRASSRRSRGAGAPAYLSLRDPDQYGWPERRGPSPTWRATCAAGMTPRLFLEPWPRGRRAAGSWSGRAARSRCSSGSATPTATLVSPRPNRYANRIPRGAETGRRGDRRASRCARCR